LNGHTAPFQRFPAPELYGIAILKIRNPIGKKRDCFMGIFRLDPTGDPATGLVASNLVPDAAFTTSDTTELIHYFHLDEKSGVSSGVWKCAPCREEFDSYPVDEMMTIISGSVTVTSSDGSASRFTKGDTVFIAKGTECVWEITETVHKFFMITE
jgi:uncharacterized cupin superfamily protein